jgi:hypothetical protein
MMWPEGEILRVRFRYHTFRLNSQLARGLAVVAFHGRDPNRWNRFPDRQHAPRKKKTVQLQDNDHNRDMEQREVGRQRRFQQGC